MLDKLNIEDLPASSRKYPYVFFKADRPCGDIILKVDGISKTIDGERVLDDLSFTVNKGDKIAFVGSNGLAKTTLFQILVGELAPDSGNIRWGVTMTHSYFPKDNNEYFTAEQNLIEWLRRFAPQGSDDETFVRGFLGRMLFSGEEALKKTSALSGGERVRCMLARMMLVGANALILDEPTNHLDLESITALNNGLIAYPEVILFSSHDHEFVATVANRIIEITKTGCIDRMMGYDDYLEDPEVARLREIG